MSATVFLLALIIVLALLSYFMKRRFGVLGLALAAGALVSGYWAESLTPLLIAQDLPVSRPQVEIVLTLLPAIILLFGGPTYSKVHMQVIGSLLFTLLAMALVLQPLGALVEFDEVGMTVYSFIDDYQGLIIIIGLLVALIDTFSSHSPRSSRKAEH